MKKSSPNNYSYPKSKENGEKSIQPKISLLEFFKASPYPEMELDTQRSKDLPREIDL